MSIPTTTLEFCSEPVDLHCPVCGQIIFQQGTLQQCCEHVIFVADSAAQNWSWQQLQFTPAFDKEIDKKYAESVVNGFYGAKKDYLETINADTAATIAATIISRKTVIMLSISTTDIGCGGMFNGTIYAIFDYLPQKQIIATFY